jgi:hypothetical protein
MISADKDIAIIFGAGASMDHLPAQAQLVRKLLGQPSSSKLAAAQSYLQAMFPGLASTTQDVTFEDIIGPLEISEGNCNWFHFLWSDSEPVTNQSVLDSLDTWLAQSLDSSLPSLPGLGDANYTTRRARYDAFYRPSATTPVAYGRLIDFLARHQLIERTAFISFNYDLLLDRSLLASPYAPDYDIDLFVSVDGPPTQPSVPLLKLHGSLNWLRCSNCHALRNRREHAVWPRSYCIDCRERTARPMLIRPTLLKDYKHRVWTDVWKRAGRLLAGASTWFFVGYSLPMADVWMLRVLLQSMRSGPAARTRKVVVVNPSADVAARFGILFPATRHRAERFGDWITSSVAQGILAA